MFWLIACVQNVDVKSLVSESTYVVQWEAIPNELSNEMDQLFHFEQMYLVLYSMRLPECRFNSKLWLPISSAYAGHSDILIPSNSGQPRVLNLTEQGEAQTTVQFIEQSICSSALTFARWDGDTLDVPIQFDDTFSVYAAGQCYTNDEWVPFELVTSIPSERILEVQMPNDGHQDGFYWQVEFNFEFLTNELNCAELDNASVNALQLLYNIQENSNWIQEYYER